MISVTIVGVELSTTLIVVSWRAYSYINGSVVIAVSFDKEKKKVRGLKSGLMSCV
jgi:hypothetical protein